MTDNINLFGLGYRRPFCFIGTLVGGAAFVVMPNIAPVSDAGWATYLTVVFVRSFGIALADAATDALLVDADVGSLGAMFQGLMNSGRSFGEIVGSGLGGVVAGPNVDPSIFYFLGAGVFMATPFSFLVAEERHTKETFDWRGLHVFSTPVVIALNFWNILGQTGDRCATIVMTRWARVEHGFTGDQLGYMNSVSLVAAIAGCLAMGYLLDRGNRRALLLGESFIFVLSNIVQLTITTRDGVWAFWLFNAFASGLHITALNRMIFLVAPRQAPGVFLALWCVARA